MNSTEVGQAIQDILDTSNRRINDADYGLFLAQEHRASKIYKAHLEQCAAARSLLGKVETQDDADRVRKAFHLLDAQLDK